METVETMREALDEYARAVQVVVQLPTGELVPIQAVTLGLDGANPLAVIVPAGAAL